MRSAAFVFAAMATAGLCIAAPDDDNNPFKDHADTGETVHVLPTPESVRAARETQPTVAGTVGGKATVYPASYGSGNLIYHGGFEISNAGVYEIFWNSSVALSTATSMGWPTIQQQVSAFVNAFPDNAAYSSSSPTADYDIIQQYSTGSTTISQTLPLRGVRVDTKATQSRISDSGIRNYLTSLFNSGAVSADASTIYGVFFPSGMRITLSGGSSCSSFCGYHSHYSYNGIQVKYAVFPYPDCSGCSLSGLSVADMLTIVMSHEIREAVTDPGDNNVNAWYDSAGDEADDKCAWHNLYQLQRPAANPANTFWVQPEYSNGTSNGVFPGPGCVVP